MDCFKASKISTDSKGKKPEAQVISLKLEVFLQGFSLFFLDFQSV